MKTMLAEEVLKNLVTSFVCEKELWARRVAGRMRRRRWKPACGKTLHSALAAQRGSASAARQAEDNPAWSFDGFSGESHASQSCVDLVFHREDCASVDERESREDDLNWAGQPVAERGCGEFPRVVSGRMLEPGAAVDPDRSSGGGGRLPAEIQRNQAAQPAGLREPGAVCGANLPISGSGRATPTLNRGWTRNRENNNIKPMVGLTHQWSRKLSPVGAVRWEGFQCVIPVAWPWKVSPVPFPVDT